MTTKHPRYIYGLLLYLCFSPLLLHANECTQNQCDYSIHIDKEIYGRYGAFITLKMTLPANGKAGIVGATFSKIPDSDTSRKTTYRILNHSTSNPSNNAPHRIRFSVLEPEIIKINLTETTDDTPRQLSLYQIQQDEQILIYEHVTFTALPENTSSLEITSSFSANIDAQIITPVLQAGEYMAELTSEQTVEQTIYIQGDVVSKTQTEGWLEPDGTYSIQTAINEPSTIQLSVRFGDNYNVGASKPLMWLEFQISGSPSSPQVIWQDRILEPISPDVDIIQQLEQQSGIKLKQFDDINLLDKNSYTLDAQHQVTGLNLSGVVSLADIPELVFSLTQLQKLQINGAGSAAEDVQATTISPKIKQLENLTELVINHNKLSNIPAEIGLLKNLTTLNLSYNKLTDLPAEIGQLQNLETLILESNYTLQNLPPEIGALTNLVKLDLSSLLLQSLPSTVFNLTNLTELNLGGNQLQSLPPEIGQLQSLDNLNLNGSQLQSLPPEIGQLQNLTSLSLVFNQLQNLPAEIGQLHNLTSLNLNYNPLQSLLAEIGLLYNLTNLDISFTQLQSLPAEIGQLQNLTRLKLKNNLLQSLPSEIGQLQNLTRLDLTINQLQNLPPEIGQLQNLIRLDLNNNQLQSLPAEIGQLQNLTRLDLNTNQLQNLPAEIGQLQNVTNLDLSGNQLQGLPSEIGQLQNLKQLYLWNNPLQSLPPEIVQLNDSCYVSISSDAPLVSPPAHIATQGIPSIRQYFTSLTPQADSCTSNQCDYSIYFDKAGYYVANISLPEFGQAGMWGMAIVLSSDGIKSANLSGVSTGSSTNVNNVLPSWIAFYLAEQQIINLTPYNYLYPDQPVSISLLQSKNNGRTTFAAPTTINPQQAFTLPKIFSGFYVIEINSTNEQDIYAGLAIQGRNMSNILNGGWVEPTNITEGFVSFYVSAPSFAQFNLLFADKYATLGASQPQLEVQYIEQASGERTSIWRASAAN
ncbi:leucine-rich repeat domain-containing protein [Candidatus Albibeggiatoa sp. nov. NOAA]|uniref:leucine-rich repeat domain-containing protein n=1 Tax=Candidatus Albibeggiatoa sp. nov. NOAA TaxID=3162724 RepID=UPI0032FE4EE6|nr:leucine-rich repeat domain-containing protein [Thiotrichaceae bacterium]